MALTGGCTPQFLSCDHNKDHRSNFPMPKVYNCQMWLESFGSEETEAKTNDRPFRDTYQGECSSVTVLGNMLLQLFNVVCFILFQ